MFWKRVSYLFTKNIVELFKQFLISLGAIWLIIEFVNFFYPFVVLNASAIFMASILFSFVWAVYKSFPIAKIKKSSKLSHISIEIRIGHILDLDNCNIAVPNSDCFDTDAPVIIGAKSVKAEFIKKEFNGDPQKVDEQLERYLNSIGAKGKIDRKKLKGKNIRFPFGTTGVVNSENRKVYFTTISKMRNDGFVIGSKESYWLGLCGLWDEVRKTGQLKPIAVPIFGGGLSRVKSSKLGLVQMIILSFVLASNEMKVSHQLIISILEKDYEPSLFMEIQNFLNEVEY